MKRCIAIFLCCAALFSLAACGGQSEDAVSVQAVSMISGGGSVGLIDRCPGKVVSGQTVKVNKDEGKNVLELLVQEGDMVEEGSVLFTYDAAAMELDLEKLRLELESLENAIVAANNEIEELERQKAMVYITNQLSYTIQIDTKKADLREAEYKKALKQREIAAMEAALEATEVTAPISGRVMAVSESAGGGGYEEPAGRGDGSGDGSAYITIMDITTYRIQGNINELNLYSLTVGMPVIIRSRLDGNITWHGTVESIDWENPVNPNQGGAMYYYGPVDEMTSSSKYPFYVTLSSAEGLILGQHVYVEPDYGQGEKKDGIWLPAWYICDAEGDAWVWAANARDRLEKRSVTLSDYNDELGVYLVTDGLALTDYLAFPEEGLTAGRSVSYFSEESFGQEGAPMEEGSLIAEDVFFATEGDADFVTDGDADFAAGNGMG